MFDLFEISYYHNLMQSSISINSYIFQRSLVSSIGLLSMRYLANPIILCKKNPFCSTFSLYIHIQILHINKQLHILAFLGFFYWFVIDAISCQSHNPLQKNPFCSTFSLYIHIQIFNINKQLHILAFFGFFYWIVIDVISCQSHNPLQENTFCSTFSLF